ncbi:MAG: hypothetical protein HY301_05530 [Verrucomicrobia bacterium]|nr:hypothetical protein [Verrucomicrobiota bacterium]
MNKNLVTYALLVVLAVNALAAAALVLVFRHSINRARVLQAQLDDLTRRRNAVLAVARDAVEYSKTNPAIDPILQQVGLKPAPPAKPAPAAPKR